MLYASTKMGGLTNQAFVSQSSAVPLVLSRMKCQCLAGYLPSLELTSDSSLLPRVLPAILMPGGKQGHRHYDSAASGFNIDIL
jgi:hypothetical protein